MKKTYTQEELDEASGFGLLQENNNFIIGKDNFLDLQINPTSINNFYYFFHQKDNRLIKQFILKEEKRVDRICISSFNKNRQ